MRSIVLFVAAVCVASSTASAQQTKTLFDALPFRGAHIAVGGGAMPYLDRQSGGATHGAEQVKLMLTFRRFPQWSIGLSSTAVSEPDTTAYLATGDGTPPSPAIHPQLNSHAGAIELQRRWNSAKMLHAMATVSAGRILNAYYYHDFGNGRATFHEEQMTTTPFAQIAAGGEINVARWMRGTALVGYRTGGHMKIAQAKGENGGVTAFLNLAFGKF